MIFRTRNDESGSPIHRFALGEWNSFSLWVVVVRPVVAHHGRGSGYHGRGAVAHDRVAPPRQNATIGGYRSSGSRHNRGWGVVGDGRRRAITHHGRRRVVNRQCRIITSG